MLSVIIITSLVLGYILFCLVMAIGNDFGFVNKDILYWHVYVVCWMLVFIAFTHYEIKMDKPLTKDV